MADSGLGAMLREARKRRGWTQKQAAEALGTHQTQIARYEKEEREAPISFVRRAEAVYGQTLLAGTPPGVPRGTIGTTIREGEGLYSAARAGKLDLFTALWALEQISNAMSAAISDIARRAREGAE